MGDSVLCLLLGHAWSPYITTWSPDDPEYRTYYENIRQCVNCGHIEPDLTRPIPK